MFSLPGAARRWLEKSTCRSPKVTTHKALFAKERGEISLKQDSDSRPWLRTARSRLKFELAGIAFAQKHGLTPEAWARHLWSTGAIKWMGKAAPTATEYLLKEAAAFKILYPEVVFRLGKLSEEEAELVFTSGCLGGWGKEQWAVASNLDLLKGDVCRYCRESFRIWARQLGLEASPESKANQTCILRVKSKTVD